VDTKKLVIVLVLVLVAMLFVIAVAAGSGRGNGDTSRPPGIVDALKGLQSGHFLTVDDVTGCPRSGAVVTAPCGIAIPARGRFSGPTRAVFVAHGSKVNVAVAPVNGPTFDMKIKPEKCGEIAVDRKGGTLTVSCIVPLAMCSVEIREMGCPH
jgi:hypothetical protein